MKSISECYHSIACHGDSDPVGINPTQMSRVRMRARMKLRTTYHLMRMRASYLKCGYLLIQIKCIVCSQPINPNQSTGLNTSINFQKMNADSHSLIKEMLKKKQNENEKRDMI